MVPAAPVPHVCRAVTPKTLLARAAERVLAPFLLPFALAAAAITILASRLHTMIGVEVLTEATPGSSERLSAPGSDYFVAGLTERGDTTSPVLVRSMAEYAERLGARVTYGALHDDLTAYFAEGGSRAHVARVVGPAATVGTRTLNDRAGVPVPTLRVDAKNAGAWSANLTVAVADGVTANTFTLTVALSGEVVEVYPDLASPAAAVTSVNARSTLITLTNLGSATAAPNNNPAVSAATALSAGNDDRAAVTAATHVTALDRFAPGLGAGATAIPGQAASAVATGLIAHARANRRIALLAPAVGTTVASAKADALAYRATGGSEHAGYFFPWVQTADGAGGTRTISPEGYVAGVRARAIRQAGPWRAPAGEIAHARHITGVERILTRADVDSLADSRVNGIISIASSVRLYGWRSLSLDSVNFKLLSGRDVLNVVASIAEVALERFVFRTIDGRGHLFVELEGEIRAIVAPMASAGGLYARINEDGDELDPGYSIDTGSSVNTAATLANNEARVRLGLRVSPSAELVSLLISKVSFESTLNA